jgi:hypothetical protein
VEGISLPWFACCVHATGDEPFSFHFGAGKSILGKPALLRAVRKALAGDIPGTQELPVRIETAGMLISRVSQSGLAVAVHMCPALSSQPPAVMSIGF